VADVGPAPAATYNGAAVAPRRGFPADRVAAIVTEVAASMGREPLGRDGRLDAACAELARTLPEEGNLPFDLVELTLQQAGLIEPPPHLIIASFSDDGAAAFEADLRERVPAVLKSGRYGRLGVGSAVRDGARRVVVAFQESFILTEPFPRRLATGGSARLRGWILAPFARPTVFVTRPDGAVDKLPPGAAGRNFDAPVTCGADGRYQIEVTGEDPYGATVLANFPLYCGVDIPRQVAAATGDDEPIVDEAAAEQRLLELLNADRRRAGLEALAWHERLATIARGHCRDMLEHGFVGHVSPTTGTPLDRVTRGGLRPATVLENVARAYSLGEVQRGLMQSPGHRRNLLAAGVTHVGIGVVLGREVAGRREVYVTQILATPPGGR
jgi:uncharacterized protein YkwD